MKHWKEAYSLAMMEFKTSAVGMLFGILMIILVSLLLITSYTDYLERNYVGFDLLFILLFTVVPSWMRSKAFQPQKINETIFASPIYILQTTLPIPLDVVIKSRIVIYFLLSFPIQLLLLIAVYIFTPFQTSLSPLSYTAFSIIWLCFGFYVGHMFTTVEVGQKIRKGDMILSVIGTIGGLIILLTFFHLLIGYGIVYLTMISAQQWPIISICISVILAILGVNIWIRSMKKQTNKLDYL